MNNKDFVARLAADTNSDAKTVQKLVNDALEELFCIFDEGNDLMIHGFGIFELKKRKERIIVNPVTMKRMLVPPRLSLSFKLSDTVKSKLK